MDINILAAMMDRQRFKNLRHVIPTQMVSPETVGLLAWFQVYWDAYPAAAALDPGQLLSLVRLRTKGMDPNQVGITLALIERLKQPVPEEAIRAVHTTLVELDAVGRLGALLSQYNDGQSVDVLYEGMMLLQHARRQATEGDRPAWEDAPILQYLQGDADEGGIQLDIFPELARGLKGLQPGDNIAVAAPTDKGKTSLLCRIAVNSARQAKARYPGVPLLYLVNEGKGSKIVNRLYQTATGLSRQAMIEKAHGGTLEALYCDVVGSRDAIRVVNIHGKNMAQIARIIEQHKPYAVITDMTGRIRAVSNKGGGANDIGQLEEVWDGMRELAAIYNFWHLGTVQVSQEGFNMLFPPLSAMQNSKTGIQTTLDLCVMMGALQNPDAAYLRGISTPKNKLARSGCESANQFQVTFNPEPNVWE